MVGRLGSPNEVDCCEEDILIDVVKSGGCVDSFSR